MNLRKQQTLVLFGLTICTWFAVPVAAQDDLVWWQLNPEETVYMQIGEGEVVFELNPQFAPKTVEQFSRLV